MGKQRNARLEWDEVGDGEETSALERHRNMLRRKQDNRKCQLFLTKMRMEYRMSALEVFCKLLQNTKDGERALWAYEQGNDVHPDILQYIDMYNNTQKNQ